MRTPDGRDCPYYYVDTHRWRQGAETCRLLEGTPDAKRWTSDLCHTCPVPEIRRANTCANMQLHGRIRRQPLRFWEGPRVQIHATCEKSGGPVEDPYVGCGLCHETLNFVVAEEDNE
jgi:hypothetical protein